MGNPVNFTDLFDFSNNSELRAAIRDIQKLADNYQKFLDIVVSNSMGNIVSQQKALAAAARELAKASQDLNAATKDGRKALKDNAQAMADIQAKTEAVKNAKKGLKETEDQFRDSVNGLTTKLKEQIATYNTLSASQNKIQMKRLAADIAATRQQITQLTNATKAATAANQAAAGSYDRLEAETKQMVRDLKALDDAWGKNRATAQYMQAVIAGNTKKLKEFDAAMNQHFRNVGNYRSAFQGLNSTLTQLGITLFSLQGLRQVGEFIFNTTVEFDSLKTQVGFASGNVIEAKENMEFLRKTAKDLGIDLNAASKGFAQLANSTKGTNFEGEETRRIFLAVAKASTVMKISVDQQQGVFNALSQMISKGKVQAEELRGQLGDRLSGAFKLFADGIGVTTAQLDKMLKSGEVSSEMLKPFAQNLDRVFSPGVAAASDGLAANISKLKNAITELTQDAGLSNFFNSIVKGMIATIEATKDAGKFLSEHKALVVILAGVYALFNQELIVASALWVKNTVVTIANTVARVANTVATEAAITAQAIYITLTNAATGSITLATAAQRLWNIAVAANPLGAAIVVITALVAAIVAYSDASERQIEIEERKAELTRKLTVVYDVYTQAYEDINQQIKNWINLSQEERKMLEEKIKLIKDQLKVKIDELTVDKERLANQAKDLTFWQKTKGILAGSFTNLFSGGGLGGLARGANAAAKSNADAMAANMKEINDEFDPQLKALQDRYGALNASGEKVVEIQHAFENALKVSTATVAGLNEKMRLLNIARDNTNSNSKDFLAVLREIAKTQKELDALDPDKILKGMMKTKKGKSPETLAREAQQAADKIAQANAKMQVAQYELEYNMGQRSYDDQRDFEDKKLEVLEKSFDIRLKLYKRDSDDYKRILAEKARAESDHLEAINKINDKEQREREKTAEKLQKREDARGRAETARGELGVSATTNGIKKRVASGEITKQQGDDLIFGARKDDLDNQIKRQQEALDKMATNDEDYYKGLANLYKLKKDLVDESTAYEIAKAEEVKQKKEMLEQATFDFAANAASSLQDILGGLSDGRIQNLENARDREIEIAGDNADAKKKIEEQYNRAIAKEKRKQAIADKLGAVFQIGLNTAIAISKAVAEFPITGGMPFAAFAAALGALQIAAVLAKPIPSYYKGRQGGPAEVAEVNERGFELLEKDGKFRVANEGKRGYTWLDKGEKVHTASQSQQLLRDIVNTEDTTSVIRSLFLGNKVAADNRAASDRLFAEAMTRNSFSKEALTNAFKIAVKDIPVSVTNITERGLTKTVVYGNLAVTKQRTRNSIGGNG